MKRGAETWTRGLQGPGPAPLPTPTAHLCTHRQTSGFPGHSEGCQGHCSCGQAAGMGPEHGCRDVPQEEMGVQGSQDRPCSVPAAWSVRPTRGHASSDPLPFLFQVSSSLTFATMFLPRGTKKKGGKDPREIHGSSLTHHGGRVRSSRHLGGCICLCNSGKIQVQSLLSPQLIILLTTTEPTVWSSKVGQRLLNIHR